jgi:hypothetical protein
MIAMKYILVSLFFIIGLHGESLHASELVFTAPEGYVENAPDGMIKCDNGMLPQVTHKQYNIFSLRNEIWAQAAWSEIPEGSFSPLKVEHAPNPRKLLSSRKIEGRYKAQVVFLVGGNGEILDKLVRCSSNPRYDSALLDFIESYKFKPATYMGRGLNSLKPIQFDF